MRVGIVVYGLALCWLSTVCKSAATELTFTDQSIQSEHTLMAIAFGSDDTIWISGAGSRVYYSQNNGENWALITPPVTAEPAEFRDIERLSDGTILLMSAGSGSASRIFRSKDEGASWTKVLQAKHENAFFDCMTFVDDKNGWLYGDSVEGRLYIQKTSDAGFSWEEESLPFDALQGEGGFASSGTCINGQKDAPVLIGTGNGKKARLLIKKEEWEMSYGPLKAGKAAGIFSLQRNANKVYVSGGSLSAPDLPAQVFQFSLDKKRWRDLGNPLLNGAIYGSALTDTLLIVSNPNGVSSYNIRNNRWKKVNDRNIWALACKDENSCWGVGEKGNIIKLTVTKP